MLRAAADAMLVVADWAVGLAESVWNAVADRMQAIYDGLAASGLGEPDIALEAALTRQREADANARGWAREAERAPQWRMMPDTIEISGEFTNLPDGVSSADLARWSAADLAGQVEQGLTDKLQDISSSFYVMRTTGAAIPYSEMTPLEAATLHARASQPGYYAGTVIAGDNSEPSRTVTCQYCGVGGQDPQGGYCGRCGGPFPPAPELMGLRRRLDGSAPNGISSAIEAILPAGPGAPTAIEITRNAAGRVVGAEYVYPKVRPASIGHSIK